jgi:hypothetical protein
VKDDDAELVAIGLGKQLHIGQCARKALEKAAYSSVCVLWCNRMGCLYVKLFWYKLSDD